VISLTGSSYLQNQIISGFDSVAQGFSATTASSTSLQTALDSFSSFGTNEMTELANAGSQQSVSGAAEFSSPATYLQNQLVDSGVQANDPVVRAFQDPSLASGSDLSGISEILTRIANDAEQKGIIIVSGSPTQLQQRASTKLEQAGLMTPPQIGGSTELDQVGLMTPPQVGGSTKLEQVGLMTPPQIGGSTKLEQAGLITPPQFESFDAITFSPQQTTALASMSNTVREAASLFQNVNVSLLGRKILG
jgi:hypothetical protein